ncbi:ATP-binding protein [Brevundimonas sp.]|uniref:ATP-binding protein n=1 Tax=Brevundimonas sp. TaxID=1871086 RepID=UPI0025E3F2E3|nr:ATP-binding protein [Brevundimonas sp.]
MSEVNFLQPGNEQLRNQLNGIIDSYSHEWDLLAELCQNAIDSISRQRPSRGKVTIDLDAPARRLVVEDNGTGIHPDRLAHLLSPFSTDKSKSDDQIGQKGVGVTFAIFSSNFFRIGSRHTDGDRMASISNANAWLDKTDEDPLLLNLEETKHHSGPTGVRIELHLSDPEHPILSLSFDQLLFVLRTRTALGSTSHIWGEPYDGDFRVRHVDRGGAFNEDDFACKYLLPTAGLGPDEFINVSDYEVWRTEKDRTDVDKRRKLKGKVIVTSGSYHHSGRTNRFWACFAPDRGAWAKLSSFFRNFTVDENEAIEQGDTTSENPYQFRPGLYVSTKGMPTGIRLELNTRGSAGYVANYFILIEDPSLNFDIGRKFIPGRLQGSLRDKAGAQFREFINEFVKYVSGRVDGPNPKWERDKTFAQISKLPNLDSTLSAFIKRPDAQEATVAAMFYEQIGAENVKNFRPLVSGYKDRYDLHAKWYDRNVVVEFKYNVRGLLKDFADERKMFDEIDAVVIWDVDELDHKEVARRGLEIHPIAKSALSSDEHFPLATHQLTLSGVNPIDMVLMRKVLRPDE